MPNKMIPFPYDKKITHFDFCYYGIYYSDEDRQSGSLFYFIFLFLLLWHRTHDVA